MAESVDALVSNTSGATHPGSIPGLGTKSLQKFKSAASFPLVALFLYYSTKIPQLSHNLSKRLYTKDLRDVREYFYPSHIPHINPHL